MEWADALGQLAQPFCHRTIFRPFAFRGRWVDLRGADGVGRPARAGGWPLATKRSDSSAERRICALEDRSTLLGHLNLVEARLAPTTRLLLAALHPTPPHPAADDVLTTAGSEDNRAPLGGSVAGGAADRLWRRAGAGQAHPGRHRRLCWGALPRQGELLLRRWWWGGVGRARGRPHGEAGVAGATPTGPRGPVRT